MEFVCFYFEGVLEYWIKLKVYGNVKISFIFYFRMYGSIEIKMMGVVSRNKVGLKRVVY